MIAAIMIVLIILAIAYFTANGFSMLQQFHQASSDYANAQAQAHSIYCRDAFMKLVNGSLSDYRYINNNCADVLNMTLVKQLLTLPSLKYAGFKAQVI